MAKVIDNSLAGENYNHRVNKTPNFRNILFTILSYMFICTNFISKVSCAVLMLFRLDKEKKI